MGFLTDGVYKIEASEKSLLIGQAKATGETWHKKLGHINSKSLNKMRDLKIEKHNCDVNCEGKQSCEPFKHKATRATGFLEFVHSDVAGPMQTSSIGGTKYFVQFQDDFSRMSFVYFMKTKYETF